MGIPQASIPSPTVSVFKIGPLPVHLYALCIVAGILFALWLTDRRWRARGGAEHQVGDVAGWAVVFGILGGRLYHLITDPELYFTKGKHPLDALKIWDGGLGIWGAIALGAVGVWIGCRRHKLNFVAFADAAAPGIVVAQALGRWGNWFNNELYGRATTLPWKLQIHDLDVVTGKARTDASGHAVVLGYYQPTFLYEMVWDLLVGALLIWLDRRRKLGRGQVFALYVMAYTLGRFWVENLRDDHANHILGMRVNSWVSILVFLGALALFLHQRGTPRSSATDGQPVEDGPATGGEPVDDGDPVVADGQPVGPDGEPIETAGDPAGREPAAGQARTGPAERPEPAGHLDSGHAAADAPVPSDHDGRQSAGTGHGDAASPDR